MKYKIFIILGVVLVVFGIYLYVNKLDILVPEIKIKFDSVDMSEIEYSYIYEGDDFLRGPKFARLSENVFGKVNTNKEIVIPSRRIVNYWPGAKFMGIQINGESVSEPEQYWIGLVFANDYKYGRNLDESLDSDVFELKSGKLYSLREMDLNTTYPSDAVR